MFPSLCRDCSTQQLLGDKSKPLEQTHIGQQIKHKQKRNNEPMSHPVQLGSEKHLGNKDGMNKDVFPTSVLRALESRTNGEFAPTTLRAV